MEYLADELSHNCDGQGVDAHVVALLHGAFHGKWIDHQIQLDLKSNNYFWLYVYRQKLYVVFENS